ncbi:MAG: peptide ABC transporter substrate-binding protein [Candidatus Eremiobacteraeota bacterium]|nr:peptide ABC transporter substrate-binding protein [Candidatus Eremiobacteraeota bacterium]
MRRFVAPLLACVLLSGCTKVGTSSETTTTGEQSAARHSWTVPGTLRIGIQTEPKSLNPLLASNTTESAIGRLMFDVLVSIDETGKKQVPILAAEVPTLQNGGISKDGLTLTYKLRHGVLWHDGEPFTSKDVKFSWSAIMNKDNNVITHGGYEQVRSVETPDPYTVVFHMKQRFAPAVNTIFGESDDPYEIVPEHLLSKFPNINAIAFNSSAPVGTGPFKLQEWARGDHITLVPNDKYFLGAPKLKKITIRMFGDENTELNALRTHDIDWQFEASPQEYKDLKTLGEIKTVLSDRNDYERIQMNTTHKPLDDVRVRQAIAYAIDADKLVTNLTFGSARVADQDLPPFMWAHAANVTHYTRDLAKAKSLLTEAGFVPGADGIMQKNGAKLALELVYNSTNATRRSAVVQVQAMLADAGIKVTVKSYLGSLLFATKGQGGILQNGKFDLAWTGWVAGIDPDQSSIFLSTAEPPNGNNETHYKNPEMDAAQKAALTNFDEPTRIAAYQKIETLLTRDLPQIPVWWPRQVQPINPDFKNFTPNPVTESWNAYQWDI